MQVGTVCWMPDCPLGFFYSLLENQCIQCTACQDTTYTVQGCTATSNTVKSFFFFFSMHNNDFFLDMCRMHHTMSSVPGVDQVLYFVWGQHLLPTTALWAWFLSEWDASSMHTMSSRYAICMYVYVCADVLSRYAVDAGTFNANDDGVCTTCAYGLFPNGRRDSCVAACEAGSYLTQGLYCQLCGPGLESFHALWIFFVFVFRVFFLVMMAGTGSCRPCAENTYAAQSGQVSCDPCPNGTYAISGSSACSNGKCVSTMKGGRGGFWWMG